MVDYIVGDYILGIDKNIYRIIDMHQLNMESRTNPLITYDIKSLNKIRGQNAYSHICGLTSNEIQHLGTKIENTNVSEMLKILYG